MPRTIKLSHESVIRKVTVAEDAEWELFDKQVKNLFGIPESDVLELAYKDEDGDVVSLNTTQELRDTLFSEGEAATTARFEVKIVGGKGKKVEFVEPTSLYPEVPLVSPAAPLPLSPISPVPAPVPAPLPTDGSSAPNAEPEPIQEVIGGERSFGSGPKTEDFLEGMERIGGEITSFVQTQLNSFLAATSVPSSDPVNSDPRGAAGAGPTANTTTVASTPILPNTVSLQYRPGNAITYTVPAWTSHPFVLVPLLLGVMHALGKAGKVLPSLFAASLFAKRNRGSKFYGAIVPLALVIFGLKVLWWLMIPMTIGAAIKGMKRMKRRMWQRRAAAWGPAGQWAGDESGFRGWDQPRDGDRHRRGWGRREANGWGSGSSSDEGWY